MSRLCLPSCLAVMLGFIAWPHPGVGANSRPNVVLILADDLGYGDIHAYQAASPIPTPNLDRLAAEGRRYTDAHTPSAVCSPTRYGLLTGRYAWRTRLKSGVLDGFDPPLIESGRRTIASLLAEQGYVTAGFGKWHVGMNWTDRAGKPMSVRNGGVFRPGDDVDFTRPITGGPWDSGFSEYFGIAGSLDMPPYVFLEKRAVVGHFAPNAPEAKSLFLNQTPGVTTTDFRLVEVLPMLDRRVTDFIAKQAGRTQPFFVYFALPSPHLPVVPSPEWTGKSGAGLYGDFVMQTDAVVGDVLRALADIGASDNTLVLFSSDNGGLWHEWEAKETDDLAGYKPTPRGRYNAEHGQHSNAMLRGTKADIFEGGHRVPLIVKWPGHVQAGQASSSLVELNDVFATLAELMGITLALGEAEDSFSFAVDLTGKKSNSPVRAFAVHHSIAGLFALREGDWKFVTARGSGGPSIPKAIVAKAGGAPGQLYNLARDPSETRNVFLEQPDVVARMQAHLEAIQHGTRTRP